MMVGASPRLSDSPEAAGRPRLHMKLVVSVRVATGHLPSCCTLSARRASERRLWCTNRVVAGASAPPPTDSDQVERVEPGFELVGAKSSRASRTGVSGSR